MNKFEILSLALEYIEDDLCDADAVKCAEVCGYSLSNLQKMFSCVFHIGISEYIARRRLTKAAHELLETDESVLEIALKYGYNSHEVFTRAFSRLWGVTPSQFRKKSGFSDIFPKFGEPRQLYDERGNSIMTSGIRFDVSELYDFIVSRRGKYVICFDMRHLMYINDTFGSKAGDAAIAESLMRISDCADENSVVIRIGGDEFIMITDFSDKADAEKTAEKVLAMNGGKIRSGNDEFEVSMKAGYVVIPEKGGIRYNELFDSFIIASRPHNS